VPLREYGKEELKNLQVVLRSGRLSGLVGGRMLPRFEAAFAAAHGARHGVGMNSAMSVLHASLIAGGVTAGDEVLCDPVCVFGPLAALYQRAKPVFVDCQPYTFNMDPELMEPAITRRTRAIIVTHMGGMPAEMDRIVPIARRHRLFIIEDCAHSLLATYKGKATGAWGDAGSFSFQASKQLSLGDGGMAITNSAKVARSLALHAGAPTFKSMAYGVHYNYRMNEQTAAIGLAQLAKMKKGIREFVQVGGIWDEAVADCPWLRAQPSPEGAQGTYHLWVATFDGRRYGIPKARFKAALRKRRLPFGVGYTNRPAYRHPVFDVVFGKAAYRKGLCPNAERYIPNIVLGHTVISLEAARHAADGLRAVVRELS